MELTKRLLCLLWDQPNCVQTDGELSSAIGYDCHLRFLQYLDDERKLILLCGIGGVNFSSFALQLCKNMIMDEDVSVKSLQAITHSCHHFSLLHLTSANKLHSQATEHQIRQWAQIEDFVTNLYARLVM